MRVAWRDEQARRRLVAGTREQHAGRVGSRPARRRRAYAPGVASTEQHRDAPRVASGFPGALSDDVAAVQRLMPAAIHPPAGRVTATVSGEEIAFAHRISNA